MPNFVAVDLVAASCAVVEPNEKLTPREREVYELIGRRFMKDEIAKILGISPKTAYHHARAVRRKYGVRRNTELYWTLPVEEVRIDRTSDYRPIDSYPLFQWSGEQSLRHDLMLVERQDEDPIPRVSQFFSPREWRRRAAAQTRPGGLYTLTGFGFDDLDAHKRTRFRFSATTFREVYATHEMLNEDKDAQRKVATVLTEGGADEFVRVCPPNNVYVNVSIVDTNGQLLAIRRGTATRDTHNLWTLGCCETLKREPDAPGHEDSPLNFGALAKKGLEKLGLLEHDCSPISISWIGVQYWEPRGLQRLPVDRPGRQTRDPFGRRPPAANVRIHAQVRTQLECHEIWQRMLRADDKYKHGDYRALDWTESTSVDVINSVLMGTPDRNRLVWTQFSALALRELETSRDVLA